jgi:hypothetical protein
MSMARTISFSLFFRAKARPPSFEEVFQAERKVLCLKYLFKRRGAGQCKQRRE